MPTSSRFAVAVHVLALLARAGGEPLKSEQIARSVNTNAVVIRRVLCALARAGLVASQTGAAGGTRLARPADEITLREVYRAVEPRVIFAMHRRRPDPRCPVGGGIAGVLDQILAEVDVAVDEALGRRTVEGVVEAVGPCAAPRRRRKVNRG
jgi:Rrf2 family protein